MGAKGAGRKDLNEATIDKALLREELRRYVAAHIEAMTKAQVEHAMGVSYLVLRHADGTFTRATDEAQIDAALAAGAEAFEIFTQTPNTQAFTALLDRTIDKPTESVEVAGTDSGPLIVQWKGDYQPPNR